MASSVDECVGKFQCMLGVLSIIVSISGTTNACWLAWNQNERHPSTKAERQGWLSGASWWSWQMLNWSFLQLFLRGLSSLAFVSGEWMQNSCSVCKPGNTLQNARSIFQHVPSFFLHFPCATLCNQSVV